MESATAQGVDVLDAVGALRWSRPDLAASLAEHLMDGADAVDDRDEWFVAAGWRVQATAACGDARDVAAHILESVPRWGHGALAEPAAARLRLELAVLAHESGETSASRSLLDSVPNDVSEPGLVADAATARLRCSPDGPVDPTGALVAWARVGGAAGQIGSAASLLITAAADRRWDRPADGVARAVDGLGRLDRARPEPRASSPSPHLAAALAAEWISSLIAAGRSDEASEGSRPLRERLADHARATRQLALLRLTLTRVAAADGEGSRDVVRELERAAHEAASSDTPQLEFICRTALAEVHDASGRPDAARESARLATVADRRHRARGVRFRTALVSLLDPAAGARALPGPSTAEPHPGARDAGLPGAGSDGVGSDDPGPAGSADRTSRLRAVQAASMQAASPRPAPARRYPTDPSPPGPGRRRRREGEPAANGSGRNGARPVDAHDAAGHRDGGVPTTNGAPSSVHADEDRPRSAGGEVRDAVVSGHGAGPDPWATGLWSAGPRTTGPWTSRSEDGDPPRPDRTGGRPLAERNGDGAGGRDTDAHDAGWDPSEPGTAGVPGVAGRSPGGRPGTNGDGGAETVDADVTGAPDGVGAVVGVDRERAPRPGVERAGSEDGSGTAAAAAALADPEAWLASAIADLDRIWGRPTGEPGVTGSDVDGRGVDGPEVDVPEPAMVPECVVVVDLARGGARLPAEESAPTVRRVARRLAQRLPDTGRLRRDSPDAVSVVLADGDRTAAAEWMRRVVPALVEGLAVDAAVQGALLRAAVHDEHGVVGAQVLRRLDDGRSRQDAAARPHASDRPERDPAGVDTAPPGLAPATAEQDGAARGVRDRDGAAARSVDAGERARHDDSGGRRPYLPDGVVVRPGSGGRRHRRGDDPVVAGSARTDRAVTDAAVTDAAVTDAAVTDAAVTDAAVTGPAVAGPAVAGPAATAPVVTGPAVGEHAAPGPGSAPAPSPASGQPSGSDPGVATPSPDPSRPASLREPGDQRDRDTTGPAGGSSSTEGLGLADLLAGALAAYRGI